MGSWTKLTIDDAKEYADRHYGKCLSAFYKNGKTNLEWSCKNGHIWIASFTNMRCNDSWCKKCMENSRKLSIEDMIDLATKKGGKCLSINYENSRSKIQWQCSKGHIFYKLANDVRQGGWCRQCVIEENRHIIEDCHICAENNRGKCLSTNYLNQTAKMLWSCDKNHTWEASFSSIFHNGTWCPECIVHKTQDIIEKYLKEIFPSKTIKSNFRNFEWLKMANGKKQEIDIYIPDVKLAIEYDGEMHFHSVECFGGNEKLIRMKQLDAIKNKKIKQHREDVKYFIRFNYKEKKKFNKKYIEGKLKQIGVPLG
jgi:hypothetical protein